jgi:hypothetical protein
VSGRFTAGETSEGDLVAAAALGHGRAGRDAA